MKLRKTKIIATLGPATESPELIGELIRAGASIFRLNMSHAAHDWVRTVTDHIRSQAAALGEHVAILIDLQGPSIRTGELATKWPLEAGQRVEFRNQELDPGEELSTTTNYEGLHGDLSVGDTLLVDNGEIHMRVERIGEGRTVCEVITPGLMGSRRKINLPGVRLNLPALTGKDHRDIALASELAVDYVAISFARNAEHIRELRETLDETGCGARIVAKIEDQEAVKNISGIITETDAVMVARGDLGIEVNIEELPVIQRNILRECARIGRKVIVATHMLESMVENPLPTRAEVTDVANAIYEQADTIMLSGETSIGKYPTQSVAMLDRIARRMEREPGASFFDAIELKTAKQKTVHSAVVLANSLPDSKLLIFTARGVLANYAAHQRPRESPIFAFTPDSAVARSLVMNRAVSPFEMEMKDNPEDTITAAISRLSEAGYVEKGDPIVILSDILKPDFDTDAILLRRV
ncbi:MAG: pyruvate kinase [Verrucomicrobiota bacterium]